MACDPLPVKGYTSQSEEKLDLVNTNKKLEENVLRQLDTLAMHPLSNEMDPFAMSQARTSLLQGFMWMNRAVFTPKRLTDVEMDS